MYGCVFQECFFCQNTIIISCVCYKLKAGLSDKHCILHVYWVKYVLLQYAPQKGYTLFLSMLTTVTTVMYTRSPVSWLSCTPGLQCHDCHVHQVSSVTTVMYTRSPVSRLSCTPGLQCHDCHVHQVSSVTTVMYTRSPVSWQLFSTGSTTTAHVMLSMCCEVTDVNMTVVFVNFTWPLRVQLWWTLLRTVVMTLETWCDSRDSGQHWQE